MTPNRMLTAWLRPFAGVFAVVAALALSACGGGSGAPCTQVGTLCGPAAPVTPALVILPSAPTIYSQVPATLTISGGLPPYRAFSSNTTVLPVTTNVANSTITLVAATVSASTTVAITVQDSTNASVSVDVTVLPGAESPLTALTVLPNPVDVYATVPTNLTVSGGQPPYQAFSSNPTVLPVALNISNGVLPLTAEPVGADVTITVTIQDVYKQQVKVPVTVHPKVVVPPTPLVVLPSSVTVTVGQSFVLAISGGLPPYKAYSGDPGALPVNQAVTGNSITVTPASTNCTTSTGPLGGSSTTCAAIPITIQDSAGQTATASITIKPKDAIALKISPSAIDIFSGVPSTLSVIGGVPPYSAFSSNPTVLPVTTPVVSGTIPLLAGLVSTPTSVTITAQDSTGTSVTSAVTVRPATLLNTLTIKPNSTDCGTNAICSGQSGTATVQLQLPGGGPASGRQVRFDAFFGPYGIVPSTGAATVASLVVISDANGNAQVVIRANVDAPTQPSQIKVTDIASGQQITGDFLIQQRTDGATILTVVPAESNITGAFKGECSTGFVSDFYIYGGTPPYRVTQGFPDATTIVNPIVNASGGFFRVVTNGTCVDPDVFSILDAAGRQTTAKLTNVEGTTERPVFVAPDLNVVPGDLSGLACAGAQYTYVVTGGTPPYNVSATPVVGNSPIVNPTFINSASRSTTVSNIQRSIVLSFVDSSSPQKSLTRSITCPTLGGPSISPATVDLSAGSCTGKKPSFTVSGGTPPYSVSFAPTGAKIDSESSRTSSPYVFTVTGLTDKAVNYVVVSDGNNLSTIAAVTCGPP